jgi:hemoglobin
MDVQSVSESIFSHAGGEEGIRRIVSIFYASIFEDPLLQPVFKRPVATHIDHLTAFLGEEFGGPPRYTRELGGFERIIAVHRPLKINRKQRERFVELFLNAVKEAGFAHDARFLATVRAAIEFGSYVALVNSNAKSDKELHPQRTIPQWEWVRADDLPGRGDE